MYNREDIAKLKEIIGRSRRIVFFGGAGVSTASGIPDFRSEDGLYSGKWKGMSPEDILSAAYFALHTADFYDFYRRYMVHPDAEPNAVHRWLYDLEKADKLRGIVTQNIDGLHQAAGSKNVLELHGSVQRNHCTGCNVFYDGAYVSSHADENGIPRCAACGEMIRPDVVLYGEGLDDVVVEKTLAAMDRADMLIIGGTSLSVYPAAGFVRAFHGKHLVLINRDPTPQDSAADLVIHDSIGKVLGEIKV